MASSRARSLLLLFLTILAVGLAVGLGARRDIAFAAPPGAACERAASRGLRACTKRVNEETRRCYLETGSACPDADRKLRETLASLEKKVAARCPDGATVQAAGYGALRTQHALVERLSESCRGEAASLAARSFGGPQGASLASADRPGVACLERANREAELLIDRSFHLASHCIRQARAGRSCSLERVAAKLATTQATAIEGIGESCANLASLVALDIPTFVERAAAQARCMLPVAHADTAAFDLDCGPRPSIPVPPRGTPVQVVLDEATWGTRCGNGSPYAFWIQLAPEGEPVERVLVHLQSGGVCTFESDCSEADPDLFDAINEGLETEGYLSSTDPTNPFRNWTKVYLPYCTQDVHIGGGLTTTFPSITVHRFGAINARAALRYARDVLWAELDAISVEGYRPDRLRVIFGGTSAGALGVSYNYHYVLDDLRWSHATAVPDAGLGLDNGSPLGLRGLGILMTSGQGLLAWGSRRYLPPYCSAGRCAVVPILQAAHSVRLEATPEQQILNVSNQVDEVQQVTTFFADMPSWIDAAREAYCANRGMPGLHYFLPAISSPVHDLLPSNVRFPGTTSAGTTISDFLVGAIESPGAVVDRVEEGSLVGDFGAEPFPCALLP